MTTVFYIHSHCISCCIHSVWAHIQKHPFLLSNCRCVIFLASSCFLICLYSTLLSLPQTGEVLVCDQFTTKTAPDYWSSVFCSEHGFIIVIAVTTLLAVKCTHQPCHHCKYQKASCNFDGSSSCFFTESFSHKLCVPPHLTCILVLFV